MINKMIDHRNISEMVTLPSPNRLKRLVPVTEDVYSRIARMRGQIKGIILGTDDRFLIMAGPCSVRRRDVALEFAKRLYSLSAEVEDKILIAMRVFPVKPRTTIGWKGVANDPHMNNSGDMAEGLRVTRLICRDVARTGIPIATEILDPLTIAYYADLVSWGAIGARTAEAPSSREQGSMMSMPVGFKNNTDGSLVVAVDGVKAANHSHWQMGVSDSGRITAIHSKGNNAAHIILRGSKNGPNYDKAHVAEALDALRKAGLLESIVVDCSHGNSGKDFRKQGDVLRSVIAQRNEGNPHLVGAMIEANLHEGSQPVPSDLTGFDSSSLKYGVSVTDSCLGWEDTRRLIREAYNML